MVAATPQGDDCPFSHAREVRLSIASPPGPSDLAQGVLWIDGRYAYFVDELDEASRRGLAPDAKAVQVGGPLRLPRRGCIIGVAPARLASDPGAASALHTDAVEASAGDYRLVGDALRRDDRDPSRAAAARSAVIGRLGPDHPFSIVTTVRLGQLQRARGNYEVAWPLFEQAWKASQTRYGADDPETLAALDQMVWARRERLVDGDLVRFARELYDLSRARWSDDHPLVLNARHTLASMLATVGQLRDGLAHAIATYEARGRVLGPQHPATLRTLNNVALAQRYLGELRAALQSQRTLYQAFEATHGPDHPSTLIASNNLALTLDELGETAEAVARLDDTFVRLVRTLGPDHPETARSLNAMGTLFARAGRFEESVDYLRRAADIRQRTQGADHPVTLNTLSNLAGSLILLERYEEASNILRAVVEGMERAKLPEDDITVAIRKNYLASLMQAGHAEAAADFGRLALDKAAALPPSKPGVFSLRIGVGEAQVAAGDRAHGIQELLRVLADARSLFGDEHWVTLSAFDSAARALRDAGRDEEAFTLLADAVRAAERARSAPLLPPDYRRALSARWRPQYARLAQDLVKRADLDLAFEIAERSKGRTLLESIASSRGLAAGVLPAADVAELRELESRIAKLEERIAQSHDDVPARAALEAERNEAVRREQARRAELQRAHPKFARLSEPQIVDARAGARALRAGTLFVSYLIADRQLVIFTVAGDGRLTARIVDKPADFVARIEAVKILAAPAAKLRERRPWRLADGTIALAASAPEPGAKTVDDLREVTEGLSAFSSGRLAENCAAIANG